MQQNCVIVFVTDTSWVSFAHTIETICITLAITVSRHVELYEVYSVDTA